MTETSNNGTSSDEEMELRNEKPIKVKQEIYTKILLNLDNTRLCLLRNKNSTMSQLDINTKETKEHMKAIQNLIQEELNSNAYVRSIAQDIINISCEVIKKQKCLNKNVINSQEKNLNEIIDNLRINLKSTSQLKYKKKEFIIQTHPFMILHTINGYWMLLCIVVLVFAFYGY
ncbi:uncharacterized protein NPIL_379331 [Nephila pilipes]|uniref:Uncharacterized protein n=1 Tax=Nephila pilipes TaxID=299642 RepID=A0A8X6T9Q4_NEPPI|nr:uncharacterized protein NPIL_379331 [Nephila pilipes]